MARRNRLLPMVLVAAVGLTGTFPAMAQEAPVFPNAKGEQISVLAEDRTFPRNTPFHFSHGMSGPPESCNELWFNHPDTRFELFLDGVNLEPSAILNNCQQGQPFALKQFLFQFRHETAPWPLVGLHTFRGEWWFYGGSTPSLESEIVVDFVSAVPLPDTFAISVLPSRPDLVEGSWSGDSRAPSLALSNHTDFFLAVEVVRKVPALLELLPVEFQASEGLLWPATFGADAEYVVSWPLPRNAVQFEFDPLGSTDAGLANVAMIFLDVLPSGPVLNQLGLIVGLANAVDCISNFPPRRIDKIAACVASWFKIVADDPVAVAKIATALGLSISAVQAHLTVSVFSVGVKLGQLLDFYGAFWKANNLPTVYFSAVPS